MKGPVPILNISQAGFAKSSTLFFFPYFVCSKLEPGYRAAAASAAGAAGAETWATLPPRGPTATHRLFKKQHSRTHTEPLVFTYIGYIAICIVNYMISYNWKVHLFLLH